MEASEVERKSTLTSFRETEWNWLAIVLALAGLPSFKTFIADIGVGIPLAIGIVTLMAFVLKLLELVRPNSNQPPERLMLRF